MCLISSLPQRVSVDLSEMTTRVEEPDICRQTPPHEFVKSWSPKRAAPTFPQRKSPAYGVLPVRRADPLYKPLQHPRKSYIPQLPCQLQSPLQRYLSHPDTS